MSSSIPIATVERDIVDSVRLDDAWALIEEFSHIVRESGTDEELRGVERITSRLEAWDVPYAVHRPELWISLPRASSLVVGGKTYRAKTPAMAASTPPEGSTAPVVYLPSGYAESVNDIFSSAKVEGDVRGRFVVTEGMPMPGKVSQLEADGAVGVICIAPGERIHEGICTTVWGSPDLRTWGRQPRIPVVSVSHPDGEDLVRRFGDGAAATIVAQHETGWRQIPVVVAELRGTIEPDRFVLVHGHLDSWHEGVGDNATGDATLLELARALGAQRQNLARSVRICWWSGHSHGRYAGSTWFADTFANDILRNCVCHINCDSPGCRDATAFSDVYWMAEVEAFAKQAIADFTGLSSEGRYPTRAGDISFNNLGVSTFFMLSSTMPEALRRERSLYAVGGCGGNIEWHTEADTIEIADRENLLRDMRLYAGAAFRAANQPVHPLDFIATLDVIGVTLEGCRIQVDDLVDLESVVLELKRTRDALQRLRSVAAAKETVEEARPVNDALLRAGRALVPLLYTSEGRYRQDPALEAPPLPDFQAAVAARGTVPDGVLRTELKRAANRLEGALLEVQDAVTSAG